MIHAEINAILHSNQQELKDSTLYVTAPPCPKCMLFIIANGIKRVVYLNIKVDSESSLNAESFNTTLLLVNKAEIIFDKFEGNLNWLENHFVYMRDKIK